MLTPAAFQTSHFLSNHNQVRQGFTPQFKDVSGISKPLAACCRFVKAGAVTAPPDRQWRRNKNTDIR